MTTQDEGFSKKGERVIMAKKQIAERPVKYPTVESKVFGDENPITVEMMKEWLGWMEETEEVKFGADYSYSTHDGKKVRLLNSGKNRPITQTIVDTYRQEHLQRRWRLNGETIVIGNKGEVLSGQHRGVALIEANAERHGKNHMHWDDNWPENGDVTMPSIVVFGIDESDPVVNTLDTGKPRSLADVLYRSEYWAKEKPAVRRVRARMGDYAIRLLWERTGAKKDSFVPRRTHSEAIDFIERHRKIIKCINHIDEENQKGEPKKDADGKPIPESGKIAKYISPGYAAALMYLMGCSRSDGDNYRNPRGGAPRKESGLNWEEWETAENFWIDLGQQGQMKCKEVRTAFAALVNPDTGDRGTMSEKIAVIVKAWALYREHGEVPDGSLVGDDGVVLLDYERDEDGMRHLSNHPVIDGIDLGPSKGEEKEEEETTAEPSVEEIAEQSAPEAEAAEPEAAPDDKAAQREEKKKKLLANRAEKKNGGTTPAEPAANGETPAAETPVATPPKGKPKGKPKQLAK